jgi:NAD(P)-dependent dehydrogenase (short-subunit alcohol dehydrogenase family)
MPPPEPRSPRLAELFSLEGRGAIVTGAGGILGRGFCAILAAHGAKVAMLDVDEKAAADAADALRRELPDATLLPLACDVSRPESVRKAVDAAAAAFGSIDVLHNNAATKTSDLRAFFASTEDYSPETWREVMGVNLNGMFLMAQAVGRRMLARGRGSIIQTASIYGVVGPDPRIYEGSLYLGRQINTPAVYSASKAGVVGLTRHLATQWGPHGIRINCLTPGGVESGQNDVFTQRYSQRVPLGRMARASEMQGALLFLASDASSYVTGQNIIVDGGLSAW